jgi:5-methylcytosine-specific restriction endonuclease McrA
MDWKRRNEDKQRAYMHAYYEAHKEQLLERFRAYREEHHAELRASRQAYWAANRDRLNADQRRRRVLNWAACAARSRAWRQAHKAKVKITDLHKVRLRRAARAGAEGTFTLEDVEQMYASQGGCCAYCGVPVGDVYDIDHIVPLSRGGSNWPGNLCIACPTCNSRKGRKPAEQFRAELAATHRVKLS